MDRGITTKHMMYCAILLNYKFMNALLLCVLFTKWLIKYLSIIKELFDIVLRAVNAFKDKYPPPQLEQINTTTKHNRISLFDNVSSKKDRNVTIAIVSQNANSAVHFLVCKNILSYFESEVNYAK